MSNTALNRSLVLVCQNNAGVKINYGDVVILDTPSGITPRVTRTTTEGLTGSLVGVCVEPSGIASGSSGVICFEGYVPQVNLNASASALDYLITSTTAGQGKPVSAVQAGIFGRVIDSGSSPQALLIREGGGSSSELGYAQITTSFTSTNGSTPTDVTGLSVTVTIGTRPVKITVYGTALDSHETNGGRNVLEIYDNTAGAVVGSSFSMNYIGNGSVALCQRRHAPSAGSRTYKARIKSADSGTTSRLVCSTDSPAFILVEEL